MQSAVYELDSYFSHLDSEEDFQQYFSKPLNKNLDSWLLSEERINLLNLFLRYRYEDHIKKLVKTWIIEAYQNSSQSSHYISLLKKMRWHDLYQQQSLLAIGSILTEKVKDLCEISFDQKITEILEEWLKDTMIPFLQQLFSLSTSSSTSSSSTTFSVLEDDIFQSARMTLVKIRSEKIFEIIMEFPESLPTLRELRDHLQSEQIDFLGRSLRSILENRLLHLGASTPVILDFYVSMISALRVLDPSDALLHYVAWPVRKYLQERKDTIRSIISSLTESKDSDLHSALRNGISLAYGIDEDDEEGGPGSEWQPKRRNQGLVEAHQARGLDVLASLVSIYGSADLFVAEFRNVLSEKLMNNLNYAIDEEVTNVELLKIRFGEDCLHACEVMLKDIQDSKRINAAIHSAQQKATSKEDNLVDMAIISEHYWPSIPRSTCTFAEILQKPLESYLNTYAGLKKPRKLALLPQLGSVDLELNFDDGSVRAFTVTPLQANVIATLSTQTQQPFPLTELSTLIELEEAEVAAIMRFWISKGVAREVILSIDDGYGSMEDTPCYAIIENQADIDHEGSLAMEVDGNDQMESLEQARQVAARVVVEEYVKGLLQSHGSMGVDRLGSLLHHILSASSSINPQDCAFATTIAGLRQFLHTLVDRGVLEVVDGLYSLARNTV
eukprot:gene6937-7676_t